MVWYSYRQYKNDAQNIKIPLMIEFLTACVGLFSAIVTAPMAGPPKRPAMDASLAHGILEKFFSKGHI